MAPSASSATASIKRPGWRSAASTAERSLAIFEKRKPLMRQALVWLTVLLVLVLAGCSRSSNRRVWGEVSYKGVAIEEGSIEFLPIEGTGGPSVGSPIT